MTSEAALAQSVAVGDLAAQRQRPDQDLVALLGGVGLLHGIAEGDLARLARSLRRLELGPGEIVWRQADACKGLAVLVAGEAQVCRQLPGERELELARMAPGDVMGELALLSGRAHTATVRCLRPSVVLLLSRMEFDACIVSLDPSAQELRQRIVALACLRLRRALAGLAATDDETQPRRAAPRRRPEQRDPVSAAMPPIEFLSRLPLLRGLDHDAVCEVARRATVLAVERGHVVQRASTRPDCCYVTLNGAVEDIVHRRGTPLRVGFAGPGHAFGYLGLLDGEPAPVSSVTRERCTLLALDRDHFAELLRSGGRMRSFAVAIDGDLVANLQMAERTLSHLAAGRTG